MRHHANPREASVVKSFAASLSSFVNHACWPNGISTCFGLKQGHCPEKLYGRGQIYVTICSVNTTRSKRSATGVVSWPRVPIVHSKVSVERSKLYVLDVDAAFAAAGKVRKEAYSTAQPQCASNLIGVTRLAFPEQLIEITGAEAKPR